MSARTAQKKAATEDTSLCPDTSALLLNVPVAAGGRIVSIQKKAPAPGREQRPASGTLLGTRWLRNRYLTVRPPGTTYTAVTPALTTGELPTLRYMRNNSSAASFDPRTATIPNRFSTSRTRFLLMPPLIATCS